MSLRSCGLRAARSKRPLRSRRLQALHACVNLDGAFNPSPIPMNSALTRFAAAAAFSLLFASAAQAQAQSPAAGKEGAPASVTVISPIYGQLVRVSMPTNFTPAFENTRDAFYIREAVLKGETVDAWTQMITITGSRGMATVANFSPQKLAASIAVGFKKACPESFAVKDLGETKLGDQDAYLAVANCGKVNSSADGHSETALIVAVKGTSDAYTIQWAERTAQAASAPVIDEAKWQGRLRELMPIRLCPIVAGEAAPYPSCLQQK